MWKEAKVTHVRHIVGLALGLAFFGCTMEDKGEGKGLSESDPTLSGTQASS